MSSLAPQFSTHRRGFLGRLTAGTLAAMGIASLDSRTLGAEPIFTEAAGADDWLAAITGTYRQFFDAVSVNDGFPFSFAMTFMNTIGETYKVPDKDITAVVGLRHFAIPLAFNDGIWAKYKLGEMLKTSRQTATVDDYGPVVDRHTDGEGQTIEFVEFKQDVDSAPYLKGLPGDEGSRKAGLARGDVQRSSRRTLGRVCGEPCAEERLHVLLRRLIRFQRRTDRGGCLRGDPRASFSEVAMRRDNARRH